MHPYNKYFVMKYGKVAIVRQMITDPPKSFKTQFDSFRHDFQHILRSYVIQFKVKIQGKWRMQHWGTEKENSNNLTDFYKPELNRQDIRAGERTRI